MSIVSSTPIASFTANAPSFMTTTQTHINSSEEKLEVITPNPNPLQNSSSSLTPHLTSLSITINPSSLFFSLSSQTTTPTLAINHTQENNTFFNLNNDIDNNNIHSLNELAESTASLTNINTTTTTTNTSTAIPDDELRKKHLRKLQNRQSAAQYRERKKDYLEKLENIVKELSREKVELTQNFNRLTKETNEANFKLCVLEAKLEMEIQENQELREQLGLPNLPEFPPIENNLATFPNYFIPNFIPPTFSQSNLNLNLNKNNSTFFTINNGNNNNNNDANNNNNNSNPNPNPIHNIITPPNNTHTQQETTTTTTL